MCVDRCYGEPGLLDRRSIPHYQPTAAQAEVVVQIEQLRRKRTWSARRIATELAADGVQHSVRTVGRHLCHLDVAVWRCISTRQVRPEQFDHDPAQGCRTGADATHTFLAAYERCMLTLTASPTIHRRVTFRVANTSRCGGNELGGTDLGGAARVAGAADRVGLATLAASARAG